NTHLAQYLRAETENARTLDLVRASGRFTDQSERSHIVVRGSRFHKLAYPIQNADADFFGHHATGAPENFFQPIESKFIAMALAFDDPSRGKKERGARGKGDHGGVASGVRE